MAGNEDRKAELIADLARARSRLNGSTGQFRRAADFPTRLRRSFAQNMSVWLGGAAMLGLVLAKMPRRTKKVYVDPKGDKVAAAAGAGAAKAGLLFTVAKLAFDAARPMLFKLATERLQPIVQDYMQRRRRAP